MNPRVNDVVSSLRLFGFRPFARADARRAGEDFFRPPPGTSSSAGAQKFTSGCCVWYRSFRPLEARLSTCLRRFGGLLKAGTGRELPGSSPRRALQNWGAPARKSRRPRTSRRRARRAARSFRRLSWANSRVASSSKPRSFSKSPLRLRFCVSAKTGSPSRFGARCAGGRERFTSRSGGVIAARTCADKPGRTRATRRARRRALSTKRRPSSRRSPALSGATGRSFGRGTAPHLRSVRDAPRSRRRSCVRRQIKRRGGGSRNARHYSSSRVFRRGARAFREPSRNHSSLKRAPRRPRGWRP